MSTEGPILGQLTTSEVRKAWKNEQYDFTPWLAREENLAMLSKALGLELEVEGIEVAVGPYSADILAKDAGSDRYVIIENQFGKTNHDHLGKLITYAAFLDASAIVWISETFTEEHRKALQWLNDHTTDEISFYGVSLELWQIDGSRPAIRFNVVSQPVELVRQATAVKTSGETSEAKQLQLEFWIQFRQRLLEAKDIPAGQTPRPQYWYAIPLGRAGIHLANIVNTYEGRIGVRVYLRNRIADAALAQLEQERAEIESEIGVKLSWNPNPDKQDKVIVLHREVDLEDRSKWPEYLDWMVEQTRRFRAAFAPRIKNVKMNANGAAVGETQA